MADAYNENLEPGYGDPRQKRRAVDAGVDGLLDRGAGVCVPACYARSRATRLLRRRGHDADMRSSRNDSEWVVLPGQPPNSCRPTGPSILL